MYAPYKYNEIDLMTSTYTPNTIRQCDNYFYNYFSRALFQRAQSVIILDNLPWKSSVKDFLFYCLFKWGFVETHIDEEFGKAFQPCSLDGFDFYYQPTHAYVSNPAYKEPKVYKIHEECEILKLTPDYMGIFDIIDKYAVLLSECMPALNMSIINSKYATIMGATSKSGKAFLEKVMDKVNQGEPGIVFDLMLLQKDPSSPDEVIKDYSRKDIKSTYLGTEILQDMATILNQFDAEIGIPTIPYQKKERMVEDEANSRILDSTSRSVVWVETLNESLEEVNAMLETNIKARHRYLDMDNEGGVDNE